MKLNMTRILENTAYFSILRLHLSKPLWDVLWPCSKSPLFFPLNCIFPQFKHLMCFFLLICSIVNIIWVWDFQIVAFCFYILHSVPQCYTEYFNSNYAGRDYLFLSLYIYIYIYIFFFVIMFFFSHMSSEMLWTQAVQKWTEILQTDSLQSQVLWTWR